MLLLRFHWALAIVALEVCPLAGAAQIADAHRFQADGHVFTAVVIKPNGRYTRYFPGGFPSGMRVAARLLARVKPWIINEYKRAYPDESPEFISNLVNRDTLDDGRSAWIIIYEGSEPPRIVATLRVAWRNPEAPHLPSELVFGGFKFPEEKPQALPYPLIHESAQLRAGGVDPSEPWPIANAGAQIEFKQFIVVPEYRNLLVPFLFEYAEQGQVTYMNFTELPATLEALESPDEVNFKGYVYPSQYLLTCHESMIPYYRYHGFQIIQDSSIHLPPHNVAMGISRAEFLQKTWSKFRGRPGYPLFQQSQELDHGPRFVLKLLIYFDESLRNDAEDMPPRACFRWLEIDGIASINLQK